MAKRGGDLAGSENTRSHLVEKRLEEMEIPTVHEGDPHGGLAQGPCGIEPPEPPADDDDMMRTFLL